MQTIEKINFPVKVRDGLLFLVNMLVFFSLFLAFSCEELDGTEDQQDEFEPNNTWQEAFPVPQNETLNANIIDENDEDFYKFTTDHSNKTYDIVSFEFTNVGEEMRICIEILDENGQSLANDLSGTAGANWTYELTCPGGMYILKVFGDDGFQKYTGPYSFKISNLNSNDEYAPNHVMDMSAEVSLDTDIEGKILSYDEEDFFLFTNENPEYWQQFHLAFTNVSSDFMVHYEVLDEERKSIHKGSSAPDKGVDLSYKFPTKTGHIFIRIFGYDYYENTKGSYTMNLSVSDPNDDNEPDDTFSQARNISSYPTGALEGTIVCDAANDNPGDYEFFKVLIRAGKKVDFTVTPKAQNTELHFGIYNVDQSYTGSSEDGNDGETLEYYLNNPSTNDESVFIKLGGFPGDNGNYAISFTESDAI